MILESRIIGRKKPFEHQPIALTRTSLTLQDLLTEVVERQVEQFNTRQQDQQLLQVLTPAAYSKGIEQGKIISGGQEHQQVADVQEAIEVAIQAFKDGLYYVFLEEEQLEDLNQPLQIAENTRILFVRLVPLIGG